jgi:hypothetical protein
MKKYFFRRAWRDNRRMRILVITLACLASGCAAQQYTLSPQSVQAFNQAPPDLRPLWVTPAVRESDGTSVLVRPAALSFTGATTAVGNRLNPTTSGGLALVGLGAAHVVIGGILLSVPYRYSCDIICIEAVSGWSILGFGVSYVLTGGIMALASMNRRAAEVRAGKRKLHYQ